MRFFQEERIVFRPREKLTVSQWAEKYRFVVKGPAPGLWRNDYTPHLIEPMDAWNLPWVRHIILCFAPQSGKTSVAINCMLYSIAQDPGPIMYIMPDRHTTIRMAQRQLVPTIKACPRVSELIGRKVHDAKTLGVRFINGSDVMLAWAGSPSALASESIRYLFRDESGKYPDYSGSEADPFSLTDVRMNAFTHTSKIMDFSTPNLDGDAFSRVCQTIPDEIRKYHTKCPKCGTLQDMSDENIHANGEKDLRKIRRLSLGRYTCIDCKTDWDDSMRNKAVRNGKWISSETVDRPRCIMFGEFPSWSSPLVSLSTVYAKKIEAESDKTKYIAYVTQHKALPYKEALTENDDNSLISHITDMPPEIIPKDCIALTAGIDTQKFSFWFVVRAWEPDLTSHLIQYGEIANWDDLTQLVFSTRWKFENSEKTLGIWRAAIDTGGGASADGEWSRTEEAYHWLRNIPPGVVFGTKGRSKGRGIANLKRIMISNIDRMPSSNKLIPGGIQLRIVDTDQFKDLLHWRLTRRRDKDNNDSQCFYLHNDTGENYIKQFLAEEKRRDRNGKVEWVKIRRDNHLFDCEVLAAATADAEWVPSLSMVVSASKRTQKAKIVKHEKKDRHNNYRKPDHGYFRPDWLNR